MRILIIGSDANSYTAAKALSDNKNVDLVFVTPGLPHVKDFAEQVDISETDNDELSDFAVANEISLTIVTSMSAIMNDAAGVFSSLGRQILAPSADAAAFTLFKSTAKKLMYRLKIPTPKFGIFDRENAALDYIAGQHKPLVIKNDTHIPGELPVFVKSFSEAKQATEHVFTYNDNKVIIEDYIDSKEASLYFLTDGYAAYPLGSCSSEEDNGLPVTSYSPDALLSDELEYRVLHEVIYPILDDLSSKSTPYCGILGVDIFTDGEDYSVIEFNPFFKQMHLQTILPLIKSDLYDLFISAAYASLSDEYDRVECSSESTVSAILGGKSFKISPDSYDGENFNYAYTSNSDVIITQKASTLTRAKMYLRDAALNLTGNIPETLMKEVRL